MPDKWTLEGYDAFNCLEYPLEGEFDTFKAAKDAAREVLAELTEKRAKMLPPGADIPGAHDWVYVVHPDGTKSRI